MQDDEDSLDPMAPFYMTVPLSRADHRIDTGDIGDGRCVWDDLDCAQSWALSEARSGLQVMVYKVIPMKRAFRPDAEMEVLGKAPASTTPKQTLKRRRA